MALHPKTVEKFRQQFADYLDESVNHRHKDFGDHDFGPAVRRGEKIDGAITTVWYAFRFVAIDFRLTLEEMHELKELFFISGTAPQ